MKKNVVKAISFMLLLAILLVLVSEVMCHPEDDRNYQWVAGFYEEPENSLDAVYIGSSNCYSFWNPLVAWEEFGITVYPYSTNAQPFSAAKYLIKEARKTQPDAVYIVNINTLEDNSLKISNVHYLVDYMPLSMNKLALINHLSNLADYSLAQRMELYFPIICYHDRWDEISMKDFNYEVDGLKGVSHYPAYLADVNDISEGYITSDEETVLEEDLVALVEDLLDYCDEENAKVVFVTVPRQEDSEEMVAKMNAVNTLIEERGYATLNLNGKTEDVSLDLTKDYYNAKHTNVHGSVKYTRYLSEYLIDNYQLEDKRGNEAYATWDLALDNYQEMVKPWLLDIEVGSVQSTELLKEPENLTVTHDDVQVSVAWDTVENADGYLLYRKVGDDGDWSRIAELEECVYSDTDAITSNCGWYFYTVVPYCEENGERIYGDFSYVGAEIETV